MKPTARCIAAMQAHALQDYPRESCGVIVRGRYIPLANAAGDPERAFRIADADLARHRAALQAIVHSHPHRREWPAAERFMPWPSRADMEGQVATDVPWIIVPTDGEQAGAPVQWGDRADLPPLLGRPFVHGVTDCYSLIRDYYWLEQRIDLPEGPRDDSWWAEGGDLYRDNFQRAGFRNLGGFDALATARPGDVALFAIRAPVPNHGGVLLADGQMLHHLQHRVSGRDPLINWQRKITHLLRHKEMEHA